MDTVIVVSDAHLREPNGPLFVREGDLWDASDPVVKRHPDAFRSTDARDVHRSEPVVETATAEPGEKRQVNRSK